MVINLIVMIINYKIIWINLIINLINPFLQITS